MNEMAKRIIRANGLDCGKVDVQGTDECFIDDCLRNLSDLDTLYNDFVKGKDAKLVRDFQSELLGWEPGEKFVFESTRDRWESLKEDADWDFPKEELSDILSGDLSEDCAVYVHFRDADGEDRYGELQGFTPEEAAETLGTEAVPMEDIAEP